METFLLIGGIGEGCSEGCDALTREEIAGGYEKIAFGGIGDAVRLLFWEEAEPPDLRGLDLFLVSEIRKPRGGGLEIKFYDRLKALQCLEALSGTDENPAGIYEALRAGASSLQGESWEKGGETAEAQGIFSQTDEGALLVVPGEPVSGEERADL